MYTHIFPPPLPLPPQSTKLSSLHCTSCLFYTWQWRHFKNQKVDVEADGTRTEQDLPSGKHDPQLLQQTQGDSSWCLGLWTPGGHTGALLEWQVAESAMTPGTRHDRVTRVPKRPRGLIGMQSDAVVIRSQGPTAQESIWPPCSHSKDILVYARRSGGAFQGLPWPAQGLRHSPVTAEDPSSIWSGS